MSDEEKALQQEDDADGALSDDAIAAVAGGLGYDTAGSFPGEAI